MLKEKNSSASLKRFFKTNKLGKLTDLFHLINTKSRMTVFRRLRELNYLSSYTHSGRYYTLNNILDFDSSGLWYFNEIGFSKFGNLKETALYFIEQSSAGYTHAELEIKLHVRTHNTLFDLMNSNKITRIKIGGEYVYFSIRSSQSKKQIAYRKNYPLKDTGLSDWLTIEILASIIRITKTEVIKPSEIVSELATRKIVVTVAQIEQVLHKFDLKKTLAQS